MKWLSLLMLLLPLFVIAGPATKPAGPMRVAYVIDASLSMKPKFADAREAVLTAVKDLPADTQFSVLIDFDGVIQRYPVSGLGAATDANKAAAERFLKNEKLTPRGDGKLDIAIAAAAKLKPAAVWLFSDGDIAGNSDVVVKRLIASAKQEKVPVHTRLSLAGTRAREEVLFKIAQDTGGQCRNAQDEILTELPPEKVEPRTSGKTVFD